jgi:hypothetical protein
MELLDERKQQDVMSVIFQPQARKRKHLPHILAHRSTLLTLLVTIMVWFAQRLPIALIPEQTLVATMSQDVVDQSCRRQPAIAFAHRT